MNTYRAFEHASDRNGDCKRWYIAQVNEDGFHGQPQYGGTMDEQEAKQAAARENGSD